jgi:hypothetical protein
VVTLLLAIMTVGVGAAANVAAKAPRLAKLAKLLEKLTGILKSAGPLHHLPTREVPGSAAATPRSGSSKPPSRNALQGGGMPEVQTPQNKPATGGRRDPIDKSKEKNYKESDKTDGSKKTTEPARKQNELRNKTANELYEEIENSRTDVADIAKHNNLKPERIQKIKDYVFDNPKHTPHKPTAEAWQRLSKGMGTEHDKLLLKHETAEMFYNDWIKKNPTKYMERYEPLTTHDITNYGNYSASFARFSIFAHGKSGNLPLNRSSRA